MKWGRNTSSPPSFRSSVITRVFPATWFSKFKQIGDTSSGKKQQRGKLDFSTSFPAGRRQARFYSLDNDAYWTLSFRKDRGEGRRRINPLSYDSGDEFQAALSRETQLEVITEVDTNKMKQGQCSQNAMPENGAFRKKKQNRGAQLMKEGMNAPRSRKLRSRVERKKKKKKKTEFGIVLDDGEKEPSNPKDEQVFPAETDLVDSAVSNSRNHQNISSQNFSLSSDEEDDKGTTITSDSQSLENKKFEEIKAKTESAYISRRSRSRKVKQNRRKAHASRSECRIQALEEMKKARIKLNKEVKDQATECSTIYKSFAVVKNSFNPQQDFRDSMLEMIREKGIRRREELEELLACYLTLNCDEHHHLIINAFQQVWFELSGGIY